MGTKPLQVKISELSHYTSAMTAFFSGLRDEDITVQLLIRGPYGREQISEIP